MGSSSRALALVGVAFAAFAGSSGCGYHAGTFVDGAGRFPGEHVALGCLDLAVAQDYDVAVDGTIVEYTFGNRCTHAIAVDFGAVRAVGHEFSNREIDLSTHDPRGEIRALALDARAFGHEEIAYVDPWWAGRSSGLNTVCVDVSHVEVTTAALPPRWVCIGRGTPR